MPQVKAAPQRAQALAEAESEGFAMGWAGNEATFYEKPCPHPERGLEKPCTRPHLRWSGKSKIKKKLLTINDLKACRRCIYSNQRGIKPNLTQEPQ
jgi:hypothetical protein